MSVVEGVVKIKHEKRTYTHPFLHYDDVNGPLTLSHDDANLRNIVEDAKSHFIGEPEDIIIKVEFIW